MSIRGRIRDLRRLTVTQNGVETLEWIGMGAVILVLTGAIASAFSGSSGFGHDIAKALSDAIQSVISSMIKPPA